MAIYSETFELYKDLLTTDEVLVVEGSARIDGYSGMLSVTAEKLYSMEQARENFARCLMLDWTCDKTAEKVLILYIAYKKRYSLFPVGNVCWLSTISRRRRNKCAIGRRVAGSPDR